MEGITVKTVRPEGSIYEQCSDILSNWRDIRSKFGYKTLSEMPRCYTNLIKRCCINLKGGA
jgi:hypothetical protein